MMYNSHAGPPLFLVEELVDGTLFLGSLVFFFFLLGLPHRSEATGIT